MHNNLKEILAERQIKHEPFARQAGVSVSTVKRWCQNRVTRYDNHVVQAFCNALDISMQELISFDNGGDTNAKV